MHKKSIGPLYAQEVDNWSSLHKKSITGPLYAQEVELSSLGTASIAVFSSCKAHRSVLLGDDSYVCPR